MSSQYAHLNAVNFNENFRNFSNFIQKQNKDFEKKADTHDSKKSDSDKSVNTAKALFNERLIIIHH